MKIDLESNVDQLHHSVLPPKARDEFDEFREGCEIGILCSPLTLKKSSLAKANVF